MDDLKIIYLNPADLTPYTKNAKKHTKKDISAIKASIKKLGGFNDPIGIWGPNNLIIEGHGRQIAALELGLERVPCIRLDYLTDEQRKAYTLAHNKTQEIAEYDFSILENEINSLKADFDMSDFGFDLSKDIQSIKDISNIEQDDETDLLPNSLRHNVFDNFDNPFTPVYVGQYDIPKMKPTKTRSNSFLRFCDCNQEDKLSKYIAHFYYDDFKFIKAWRDPDCYVDRLKQFKAVISPDFSLYTDMPKCLQIMSAYRRQWVGAYWQSLGIDVIPDVVWGREDTFDWCFDGVPKGGTVAVSSVGVKADKEWNGINDSMFLKGWDEMMKRIQPKTVLFYGDMIKGIEGNIIHIPSFYAQKRELLNERKKIKQNGAR